jgi:hypothetical protein
MLASENKVNNSVLRFNYRKFVICTELDKKFGFIVKRGNGLYDNETIIFKLFNLFELALLVLHYIDV